MYYRGYWIAITFGSQRLSILIGVALATLACPWMHKGRGEFGTNLNAVHNRTGSDHDRINELSCPAAISAYLRPVIMLVSNDIDFATSAALLALTHHFRLLNCALCSF